jgi:hypothetical protein
LIGAGTLPPGGLGDDNVVGRPGGGVADAGTNLTHDRTIADLKARSGREWAAGNEPVGVFPTIIYRKFLL